MFIVTVRDMNSMKEFFYTGRVGAGAWLSERRQDAFAYTTEQEAARKAKLFQRQYPRNLGTNGIAVWMVKDATPEAAHAAGARAMSEEACGL